jgi:two-component system, chemotaxis family, sensor kinase CheA
MTDDAEFLRELRATFRVEAAEHLAAMSTGLLALEKGVDAAARLGVIETVFRAAHSLKGAARAVDLADIERTCQSLETLFAKWKRGEAAPTPESLDSAMKALDQMDASLSAPAAPEKPKPARGRDTPAAAAASATASPAAAPVIEGDTVRVPVSTLDARLIEAEELLSTKLAAHQRGAELEALLGEIESWRREWARVQPEVRSLRRATDAGARDGALADFFEWNHDYMRAFEARLAAVRRAAEHDSVQVGKVVNDLLENSKKLLMLPLATLGTLLPKVVRDLARDQGKDAELTLRGEDVRIDKRILEEMKDPLIHLLRNAVDHGVESPAARRAAGKAPRATIALTVTQLGGNQVELEIADDGAGIDVARVRAAAIQRGLLTSEAAQRLTDEAAAALVFEADLSTSPMITQVSGRGLGLAIVREKAEKLGGRVAIEARKGAGTRIRVTLPLTLATFRGVVIHSGRRSFVVPTSQVERVARFKREDVRTVEGRDTITLDGRAVALASLADVLSLPPARPGEALPTAAPALIIGSGEHRLAIEVDAVVDEREVLVKRFAKPLVRVRNIAGATVLGNGEVAPILDVTDLIRSARNVRRRERADAARAADASPNRRVLVAEDSITSRMLIKGILESAGYEVKTAVDGIEAYTLLRSEKFDALVSDVEMPRLNGFDLTARVRADRTLADLPVLLVTALESREDRERGIDVGANAYLVKSNLDQSNLLDALRRLT